MSKFTPTLPQLARYLLISLSLFLTACNSLQKSPEVSGLGNEQLWREHQLQLSQLENWKLQGKIAVRAASESGSGSLNWQQQQQQFDIRISGPFGQGAIQLSGTSKHLELTTAKQKISSNNPQLLMQQQLGWSVPVENLLWWIRGLPAPKQKYQLQLNDNSQAWRIEQQQWTLEYLAYQQSRNGLQVPQRIRASGPNGLQLIILIKDWQ